MITLNHVFSNATSPICYISSIDGYVSDEICSRATHRSSEVNFDYQFSNKLCLRVLPLQATFLILGIVITCHFDRYR